MKYSLDKTHDIVLWFCPKMTYSRAVQIPTEYIELDILVCETNTVLNVNHS